MLVENSKIHISTFTIDVEDGVSIAMRDVFNLQIPQTDRVVRSTNIILELLAKHQTKGTFFTLGQVAANFKLLLKSIVAEGHEIGVHGYDHLQFFRMNHKQAKNELSRAKKILEDITGKEVIGHRAPAFSVMPATAWALDVIAECGFTYDSSIIPVNGQRYGWPGFPKDIIKLHTSKGNQLVEVPISSVNMLNKNFAFSGGGYLRLFPFCFIRWAFNKELKQRPVILYLHPYELDTARYPNYYFAAMEKASFLTQLKMRSNWLNRDTVAHKLSQLLTDYSFTTMQNLINNHTRLPLPEWHISESGALLNKMYIKEA